MLNLLLGSEMVYSKYRTGYLLIYLENNEVTLHWDFVVKFQIMK